MAKKRGLTWAQIERRGRVERESQGDYPCDYGHNHRSARAKRECEERNDRRGLPRGAR